LQVRARQLWGTDVYTEDSDLVAVLVHAGFYSLPSSGTSPPPGLAELRATLLLLPPQEGASLLSRRAFKPRDVLTRPLAAYASTARHGLRSRCWGGAARGPGLCAFRVSKCAAAMSSGAVALLDPEAPRTQLACPTFTLGAAERGARAEGRRGGRGGHAEVTILYSLSNEPWLKYSLAAVADRGLQRSAWTSARLRRDVLFLESKTQRFQLAWEGHGKPEGEREGLDAFSFSRCRQLLELGEVAQLGVPLPASALSPLARGVGWESVKWGPAAVSVAGESYPLLRVLFLPAAPPKA
jgi:hypothetical protein